MRRLLTGLAAACAVTLGATAAQAEVTVFARAGGWEAFGGSSRDGQLVCGVSTKGGGKWLGVKYFKGDSTLTLQLSNSTWTAKDGLKVAISMRFDSESPWKATATSFHMSDGDAALEFEIDEDQIGTWLNEFRASDTLVIRFPNSDVADWQASLRGSSAIADRMLECLRVMRRS